MQIQVERWLLTVQDYHAMAEAGILGEDDRVELIEGELITMSPIGVRHMACVNILTKLFVKQFDGEAIVSVQNPLRLSEYSEPEPDIALFKYRDDFYREERPTSEDVLLCVEVSHSTLGYDRGVKRPLYARAGIREYWLINLNEELIELFRQPESGEYQVKFRRYAGESISVEAFPDVKFQVSQLLS